MKGQFVVSLFTNIFLAFSFSSLAFAANTNTKSYQVSPTESEVKWEGKKVTGAHDGMVSVKEGNLDFKKGILTNCKIIIDMNSITNKDLTDKEYNQKLVTHLKSDDFFAVDKYPEAVFETTKIRKGKGKEYKIDGNMTIKGVSKPVGLTMEINEKGGAINGTGTMKLDRTLWDIRYGSGKFFEKLGDKMIYDDFELTLKIVAK